MKPTDRFWIDGDPNENPFKDGGAGVVDEEKGGIVAYFGDEEDAKLFVEAKRKRESE